MKVAITESEIQQAYSGRQTAEGYVRQRFESELMRLVHDKQVHAVQRLIRQIQPSTILEIAPGPGRITREIDPPGRLTCLEYNAEMIEQGKRECSHKVDWIQGNAFELPFSGPFDLVYSFRFIRHFRREDRDRLYRQIHAVLNPGGWLILDAVHEGVSRPLRERHPEDYPVYDVLYRDVEEIEQELNTAGFAVERIEPVQTWFSMQYRAQVLLGPRSRRLCRWAIRLLERLRSGPPLEWVVTARKCT